MPTQGFFLGETNTDIAVQFVAYVYPGWHFSLFRPTVNEWSLLTRFKPYFHGHLPPPQPVSGPYDDSAKEIVGNQLELAHKFSLAGFTYFLYFQSSGYVFDKPLQTALEISRVHPRLQISTTWCMRLPHNVFPILSRQHKRGAFHQPLREVLQATLPLDRRPLNQLSIADLEALFGPLAHNLSAASLIKAFSGHR